MAQKSRKPGHKDTAWRIDGISPEAVAAAEQAAAHNGVALSVWISGRIRDAASRERAERASGKASVKPDQARRRAPSH